MNVFRAFVNAVMKARAAWAAPKRRPSRVYVKPRLEALEERECPSTTTWMDTDGNFKASDSANWSNGLPSATNQAILDGSVSNDPINFDTGLPGQTITCNGIVVQNNYSKTMDIASGVTVKTNGFVTINSGNTLTLTVHDQALQLLNGSIVADDGTLNLNSNAGAAGVTFIKGDGASGERINVAAGGNLNYNGQAGTSHTQDEIDVGIGNAGTFTVDGKGTGGTGAIGSWLYVNAEYDAPTITQSVWNDGGTVSLKGNTDLVCRYGYLQDATDGGTTQTTDGNPEAIDCGNPTLANPDQAFKLLGGFLKTAPGGTTYDTLTIEANGSEIGATAEVDVKVDATNSMNRDKILFVGGSAITNKITWDAGSKAQIIVNGTLTTHGKNWGSVISDDAGSFNGTPTLIKNGTMASTNGGAIVVSF